MSNKKITIKSLEKYIENKRKVCVIGERTASDLFEKTEDPVGKYVRIDNVYFKVIGVLVFRQGSPFDSDSDVFIPFTTYQNLYNSGDRVGWLNIAAYDDVDVVQVEKDIKQTLKKIKRVSPDDERAFGSFNLGEIFNSIMGFAKGMTFLSLIVGIATILAGVIGIGNILLISVKERTKELGVRRALGATPGEVRVQIILESVFLTIVAGIFGIILGVTFSIYVENLRQFLSTLFNISLFPEEIYFLSTIPYQIDFWSIFLISSCSIIMTCLVSIYPATKAAKLDTIKSLKYE